jgi:hypothetical protein
VVTLFNQHRSLPFALLRGCHSARCSGKLASHREFQSVLIAYDRSARKADPLRRTRLQLRQARSPRHLVLLPHQAN